MLRHAGMESSTTGTDTIDEIHRRAVSGETEILNAISEVGRWLGIGVGNLINTFNPELVVLGGLYHRLYEFLEAAVTSGVGTQALDAPGSMVSIARSHHGEDAPLVGAAELALIDVVADPTSVKKLAPGRATSSID